MSRRSARPTAPPTAPPAIAPTLDSAWRHDDPSQLQSPWAPHVSSSPRSPHGMVGTAASYAAASHTDSAPTLTRRVSSCSSVRVIRGHATISELIRASKSPQSSRAWITLRSTIRFMSMQPTPRRCGTRLSPGSPRPSSPPSHDGAVERLERRHAAGEQVLSRQDVGVPDPPRLARLEHRPQHLVVTRHRVGEAIVLRVLHLLRDPLVLAREALHPVEVGARPQRVREQVDVELLRRLTHRAEVVLTPLVGLAVSEEEDHLVAAGRSLR